MSVLKHSFARRRRNKVIRIYDNLLNRAVVGLCILHGRHTAALMLARKWEAVMDDKTFANVVDQLRVNYLNSLR